MGLKPVTVSQLNGYIKRVLSSDPLLGNLAVAGEISNLKRHNNGHIYFSLKDAGGKINCFLHGDIFAGLPFAVSDGMAVVAEGHINVWEQGGTYSLSVRAIRPEGVGALAAAFEKMKAKLSEEGLFRKECKKPLPAFPKAIGLVTSPTGAVIEDMIKIITEKNDYVDIYLYPTLVQGSAAAAGISGGIAWFNANMPGLDLLIIGRGGGSSEELWAFNEESVARAVFDSIIPVISAVGHETDVTISDFVADARAETPTAAAHMAVPDMREVRSGLAKLRAELGLNYRGSISGMETRLKMNSLSDIRFRMEQRLMWEGARARKGMDALWRGAEGAIGRKERACLPVGRSLDALNPLSILDRGYSVIMDRDGRALRSVCALEVSEPVTARMRDGKAELRVEGVRPFGAFKGRGD